MTTDKLDRGFKLDFEIQFLRDLLVDHKWDHNSLRVTLKEALSWTTARHREYSVLSEEQLIQIAAMVKSALAERLLLALAEFEQL